MSSRAAITLYDVLKRFRVGRGTGTVYLEDKLLQQLMSMREAVLFEVFLEPQKAYNAVDRDRCLDILATNGVFPRKIQRLRTYWGRLTMVARAGRYFGMKFKGYRNVTQGNHLPPTIFNMVMNAVIC